MERIKVIKGIKIDPQIFTFPFSCKCAGECCHYGVYTDLKEHDHIISLKDKIIPLMDESQPKNISLWFEKPEKDNDFESGVAVGTELYNGKCVFLDKEGLCTLQKLALKEGVDQWYYKPLYCILFPLTIFENTLTVDNEHMERLNTCNSEKGVTLSIYESCKDELRHLFGEAGMEELENYRNEYLSKIQKGVLDGN